MTELRPNQPLKRETALYYRGRALVVTMHPGYVTVRQKGKRIGYSVPYDAIFDLGAKIEAAAQRAEKMAKRKMVRK